MKFNSEKSIYMLIVDALKYEVQICSPNVLRNITNINGVEEEKPREPTWIRNTMKKNLLILNSP